MGNIVFYFSGTGNCLKAAREISKELGETEIVSMGKREKYAVKKQYDTVGFVYPVYFWGLPKRVIEFVESIDLGNSKDSYIYALTTFGGSAGNSLYQIYELLNKNHNVKMNYSAGLKMFSNYVIGYDMKVNVDEITKRSNEGLAPIIAAIKARKNNKVNKLTKIFKFVNKRFIETVSVKDCNYTVGNDCTGCGICKEVCPVGNIEMVEGRPQYKHTCEQCLACLQFCPKKLINYRNATQNRRRYTHPDIGYKDFMAANMSGHPEP